MNLTVAYASATQLGVLTALAESDPEAQLRMAALRQGLQSFGWTEGRNIHIDYRWPGGSAERMRTSVAEIVGMRPDVIFAGNSTAVYALKQATSSLPIVFVQVPDPIADGFVASLILVDRSAT